MQILAEKRRLGIYVDTKKYSENACRAETVMRVDTMTMRVDLKWWCV